MHFNPVELIIILLIVVVLFGAGRVGKLGGELGTAVREFRRGLQADDTTPTKPADDTTVVTPPTSEIK